MAEDVVGLRFISEGEEKLINALQQLDREQKKVSATTRALSEAANKGLITDRERTTTLQALARASVSYRDVLKGAEQNTKMAASAAEFYNNKLLGVNQAKKSAQASAEVFIQAQKREEQATREAARAQERATRERKAASSSYQQLRASIDPTFAAQQRMRQAHDTVRNALRQELITRKQAADTLRRYRASLSDASRGAIIATTATGRMRAQFLATANTIAILDGPLGGVASRFSAFGVLLGRTGFLLAGVAVAATALFTVIGKGIQSFAAFEAQTARINAVLNATGNQVGKTTKEIESFAASLALSTLESEASIRSAAGRLLTFRNVSGDVFEDTLKAATDLAAIGFGTVESAAVRLAKALEDPRQSLTSLSRAGVTFTRQQREMIIAMVDSGQRAEAMAAILENVNKQTGGVGAAAARDTLAGQFDTIGQAAATAARKIGQTALETTGLSDAIETLSDVAGAALGLANIEPEEKIRRLREEVERARAGLLPKSSLTFLELMGVSTAGVFSPGLAIKKVIKSFEAPAERTSAALQEIAKTRREMSNARAAPFIADANRMDEGIADLQADIALRKESLGLTEKQQRANKILAQNGLLIFPEDIPDRVEAFRLGLVKAGRRTEEISDRTNRFRELLQQAAEEGDNLRRTLSQSDLLKTFDSGARALQQQNESLTAQIPLLREGLSVTEAREKAQNDIKRAVAESAAANEDNTQAVRDAARELLASLDLAEDLKDEFEAATRRVDGMNRALSQTQEAVASIISTVRSLEFGAVAKNAEAAALEQGKTEGRARIDGILAGERARLQEELAGNPNKDLLIAANLGLQRAALEDDLAAGARLDAARNDPKRTVRPELPSVDFGTDPASGGGGSSSRAAEQVKTLKGVTQELERQIGVRIKLAQASDKERVVLETISEITDRLDEQGANYTDEEIRRAAERIAKREEEAERADRVREANERVQQSAEDAFTSFITGAEGARDAIDNMLDSLLNLLAQEVSGSIFDGLLNGSSFGDATSSLIGSLIGGGSSGTSVTGKQVFDIAGSFASADGGGYTGPGPRSGGLDGKGGFMMMMHPEETIIDHTKGRGQGGQVVNNIQVIAPPGSNVKEERQQNGSGGEDLTILIDQAVSGLARDPSSRLSRALNTGFGISPTRRSR